MADDVLEEDGVAFFVDPQTGEAIAGKHGVSGQSGSLQQDFRDHIREEDVRYFKVVDGLIAHEAEDEKRFAALASDVEALKVKFGFVCEGCGATKEMEGVSQMHKETKEEVFQTVGKPVEMTLAAMDLQDGSVCIPVCENCDEEGNCVCGKTPCTCPTTFDIVQTSVDGMCVTCGKADAECQCMKRCLESLEEDDVLP